MQLYPKEKKPRGVSHRRWRIDAYLAYDGGGTGWTDYYRTLWGAKIAAWYHYHLASYGGSIELTDTFKEDKDD